MVIAVLGLQWIITIHGLTGFIFVQARLCIRYWHHAEPSTVTATTRLLHLSRDLRCKCIIKHFFCAPCIDSSKLTILVNSWKCYID